MPNKPKEDEPWEKDFDEKFCKKTDKVCIDENNQISNYYYLLKEENSLLKWQCFRNDFNLPKKVKQFIKETRQQVREEIGKKVIECLGEEIDIGEGTLCKTCAGHIAAGECDCVGKNQKYQEIKQKLNDLFKNI